MKKITLITGGIRSGKSKYAVKLAQKQKGDIAFIATAVAFDEEISKRIKKHRETRPKEWTVFEEPKEIARALIETKGKYQTILIDCLGLFISNLLLDNLPDETIEQRITELAHTLGTIEATIIIVSNEVGSGLVPDNKLGRRFCDLLGMANQCVAQIADSVVLMAAGIPIEIKKTK